MLKQRTIKDPTLQEKAFNDLIFFANWTKADAFRVTYPESKANEQSVHNSACRLYKSFRVRKYREHLEEMNKSKSLFKGRNKLKDWNINDNSEINLNQFLKDNGIDVEQMNEEEIDVEKDSTAIDKQLLYTAVANYNTAEDSKKLDWFKAISDIVKRFKMKEIQKDTTVLYRPVKCSTCEIYNEKQQRIENTDNQTDRNA